MTYPPSENSGRSPRAHFCGIGGTAMVAGARLALEAGWEVRGSDQELYPPASAMVEALNVPVAEAYGPSNLDWDPDVVIIGNVLSRGNAEVEAVLERHLPYVSLPEWLKESVLRARRPIVITGTHGKTTTSALTAHLLDRAGSGGGYLIGGQPLGFRHSSRLGETGQPFVIEGDEYDTAFFDKRAKFFHYLPETAVVTSLEFDHGDVYRDVEEIELAFQRMLRQIPRSGHLILCADSARVLALRDHAPCNVITYGADLHADWCFALGASDQGLQSFSLYREGAHWHDFRSTLHGAHNVANAVAALIVHSLYADPARAEDVAESLAAFEGVKRRMEVFHEGRGIVFIDDFAHHPTAIKATLAAARCRWPGQRVIALFEPRSNTLVTNRFQEEVIQSLLTADAVWIGPIHRAESIDPGSRLDRARVVARLTEEGIPSRFSDSANEIVGGLREDAIEDDVVLVMSNGAFDGIYEQIKAAF